MCPLKSINSIFFSSVQMLALRHKILFALSEKLLESIVNAVEARAHQYIILTFFNCTAMGRVRFLLCMGIIFFSSCKPQLVVFGTFNHTICNVHVPKAVET